MSYYSRKNREKVANRMPKYERDLENKKNNSYASKLIDEERGLKRIVQYVDDPDNSSALARVRKMSESSKSRRNSPKNSDEELENTEKNRLLFKGQKYEEEEPVRKKGRFFDRKKYILEKRIIIIQLIILKLKELQILMIIKLKIILWSP
jgi:hypothetical protein